ncbi:MAG TPA: DUF4241 domain-containing protein [Actinophytocola sp.]|uniref:DUF4241 domain-containing protein n=1 Tax=Actinophytocola sp. TaxID=1872138 RepID=UPI002DB6E8EF|nr:DUF4241 domain-containing protein [Actinophytocola sp.]HEU5473716.1 DUF4241 domain-containing protein [Actinophytocola sp.]
MIVDTRPSWWSRQGVWWLVVVLFVGAWAVSLRDWRNGERGGTAAADPQPAPVPQDPGPPIRRTGFESLFQPGAPVRVEGDPAVLAVREVGTLDLPSGRLIACDPFVLADFPDTEQPFQVAVPPGRYPVSISLTQPAGDTPLRLGTRVVAARLTIRPEPVTRWDLALRPGDDPTTLQPNEFFGFGVDTGTAAFLDAASIPALQRIGGPEGQLSEQMDDTGLEPGGWDVPDPVSGHNVIAFNSGLGDGAYPTWIGWTATNQPAVFVTDFLVVD